jgi:Zn-dependent M28 family amino/carboxypeptidase
VGFTSGNIALIQRGTCPFATKVLNAKTAGASAVIIFNEGQIGRQEAIDTTLGNPLNIPVIGTSYQVGVELFQLVNPMAHLSINAINDPRVTSNLIAETSSGRMRSVIMLGAHLDSVSNAGINDNGSGVASLLEIALQMKAMKPLNKIRFAFWGAEESGTKGSEYYVLNQIQKGRLNDIEIYLNFDMVGSPNHILDIHDASPNIGGYSKSIVTNMTTATKLFENYFTSMNEPFEARNGDPNFFDRGDHANFAAVGIPIGGLDLGADDIKTPEQVVMFGGTAGIFADPCYHKSCDDINNVNIPLTARMADAIATVLATYAFDKKADGSDGALNYDPSQPNGVRKGHLYYK